MQHNQSPAVYINDKTDIRWSKEQQVVMSKSQSNSREQNENPNYWVLPLISHPLSKYFLRSSSLVTHWFFSNDSIHPWNHLFLLSKKVQDNIWTLYTNEISLFAQLPLLLKASLLIWIENGDTITCITSVGFKYEDTI